MFPGDIIKGDSDGIMVIPKALAEEVGRDGVEQERYECFAKLQVSRGARVPDVYPATEQSKADYAAWIEAGEPEA